jgi:hypothetical protein
LEALIQKAYSHQLPLLSLDFSLPNSGAEALDKPMSRQDISEFLLHFTKDINLECAFIRLQNIIRDRMLIAGDGFIKGGYKCVCFSEAPLSSLSNGLINPNYYSAYSPFGILVSKTWLYQRGGRPAIYQPDSEFHLLPSSMQWRHVRYEPPRVDFSWEREWRIRTDFLEFDNQTASIAIRSDL